MDPEASTIVATTLANVVWHALDQNLLTTALFTAERLYQEDSHNADSVHLVALAHYRAGEYHRAAELYTSATLEDARTSVTSSIPASGSDPSSYTFNTSRINPDVASHTGCLYIYALSCLALGEHSKGILALERSSNMWKNLASKDILNASPATSMRLVLPTAAMIYTVLGHLYRAVDSDTKAIKSYAFAVRLDPLMWEATEALCHYGIDLKVENMYKHLSAECLPGATSLGLDENGPDPMFSFNRSSASNAISNPPEPPPHFFIKPSSTESFNQRLNLTTLGYEGSGASEKGSILRPRSSVGSSLPSNNKSIFGRTLTSSDDIDGSSNFFLSNQKGLHGNGDLPMPMATPETTKRTTLLQNAPLKRNSKMGPINTPINGSISTANSANNSSTVPIFATELRRSTRLAEATKKGVTSISSIPTTTSKLSFSIPTTSSTTNNSFPSVPNKRQGNSSFATRLNKQGPDLTSTVSNSSVVNNSTNTIPIEYHQALNYLITLYSQLTSAFLSFSKYDCDTAIRKLSEVPSAHAQSPFCLALYARLYFEKVDYTRSLKYFEQLKQTDRFRVKDMDYYSTLLWHLRKDYELSYLASDMSNYARNRAQTWCTIGNACSLQHETEAALRCFRRAAQIEQIGSGNISPGGVGVNASTEGVGNGDSGKMGARGAGNGGTLGYSGSTGVGFVGGTAGAEGLDGTGSSGGFGGAGTSSGVTIGSSVGNGCGSSRGYAYAYTLQAHEYVGNDAFEHAQDTYRLAIRADKRHYNAWYGLGMVFLRLGDTKMAELHFRKAAQINPVNVVLMCCIGMVLEKTGRLEEALEQYTNAINIQVGDDENAEDTEAYNRTAYDDDENFEDEENEFEDGSSYQDEDSLMGHHNASGNVGNIKSKLKSSNIKSKSTLFQKSANQHLGINTLRAKEHMNTNFPSANSHVGSQEGLKSTDSKRRQGSAMARYKRARLLVKLKRYPDALNELQILERVATDEASVYFLLGQVYKLLGQKESAVKAFTVALNLDPKGAQMIEEALESLEHDNMNATPGHVHSGVDSTRAKVTVN